MGPLYQAFLDQWQTLNSTQYPGAGVRTINSYAPHAYDCVYTFARAFHQLFYNSTYTALNQLSVNVITSTVRSLAFVGLTGDIEFEPNGDRKAIYQVLNLRNNDTTFTNIGTWNDIDGGSSSLSFYLYYHNNYKNRIIRMN